MSSIAPVRDCGASDLSVAQTGRREHIAYIEYFRALAILMIISGHTFVLAWTHFADEDPTAGISLLNVIPILINSGTAYFVFISGFLYRQVFYGRIAFGEFMRRKALYIGLPYLCIGTPVALAEIYTGTFSVTLMKDGIAYPPNAFVDLAVLMATGRMVNAYWYMPFIFLVFLASPLFDRFMRQKPPLRLTIVAAAFVLAMWVHRPLDNLNPFHSFLYFANIYMFGMLFCEYRKAIIDFVARPPIVAMLATIIVAIALVQALVLNEISNIERAAGDGWMPLGVDLMLLQKYVGFFLFCGFFALWGGFAARPLSLIAKYSFGLYFVHAVVIAVLMRMPAQMSPHVGEPIIDFLLYTGVVLTISSAAIFIVKQITGRYSRYIIGC